MRRYARRSSRSTAREHEISRDIHHQALRQLGAELRAELPQLVAETEARLRADQPETVAALEPELLRAGVTLTHARFIALLEGRTDDDAEQQVGLARAAAVAGLPVDALLAGYRVGARIGWRRVARHVREHGVPAEAVMELATASLAYVDELTAETFEGFGREAAAAGGARARARQALLAALVAGREQPAELERLAAAASWPLPPLLRIAVVLEAGGSNVNPSGGARAARRALDEDAVLLGHVGDLALAAVAERDAQRLADGGAPLALGPPRPPSDAAASLEQARRLAALASAGVAPAEGPLRWEDHLADLVVHADPVAGAGLAAARLAPLEGLPPARAAMLGETLAAWLEQPGRPRAIAARLHLHPQTVRYRLARLRERFGDALDDPAARVELALALRLRRPGDDAVRAG